MVLLNFKWIVELYQTTDPDCYSNVKIYARLVISDPLTSNNRTDKGQTGSNFLKSDSLPATRFNKFTHVEDLKHCLLPSKNLINTNHLYNCFVIIIVR